MSLPPFDHSNQTTFTEPPIPTWSFSQPVDSTPEGRAWLKGEEQGWKIVNTAEYDRTNLYKLMISGIVPRPIAFVSSISVDGVENLAPFRYMVAIASILYGVLIIVFPVNVAAGSIWLLTPCVQVTHWPPLVSICFTNTPARLKDTAVNIRSGNGFTVNIISEPFVRNANVTSIDAPPGFDEWSISGLTKAPSVHVKACRVKESAFSMECELFQAIDIVHPTTGECTNTFVLAHVKYIHVRNDMLTERGTIDATKFKPIARMGDITYALTGDAFRIPRPVWATEESKVQEAIQRL